MKMRYFGNTHDPRAKHAEKWIARSFDETQEQAIEDYARWLSDKLIGDPQGNKHNDVQAMKDMGMVGVYGHDIDEYAKKNPKLLIVNYDGPFHSNRYRGSKEQLVGMGRLDIQLETKVCSDCKGKGTYAGLNLRAEPCRKCNGSGKE